MCFINTTKVVISFAPLRSTLFLQRTNLAKFYTSNFVDTLKLRKENNVIKVSANYKLLSIYSLVKQIKPHSFGRSLMETQLLNY